VPVVAIVVMQTASFGVACGALSFAHFFFIIDFFICCLHLHKLEGCLHLHKLEGYLCSRWSAAMGMKFPGYCAYILMVRIKDDFI
jgi:hypothetical protein